MGGVKPILKWWTQKQYSGDYDGTEIYSLANCIVNDYMDLEFYLLQSYNSKNLKEIAQDPYYLSQAHSAHIAYSSIVRDLINNVDQAGNIFPIPNLWVEKFIDCKEKGCRGHAEYKVYLIPLGLLDILEGQARMIQLQYLRGQLGRNSLKKAKDQMYLEAEYGNAFLYFLECMNSDLPNEVDDPLVALFLLICDIALNPNEGLIDNISDFENFHNNVDAGYRFLTICHVIENDLPHLKSYIQNYSKAEYMKVSQEICQACGYVSPYDISIKISKWENDSSEIKKLLDEHHSFEFSPINIGLRLVLSEFISFNKDKVETPEFFCWPGIWLYNEAGKVTVENEKNWTSHLALYTDTADGEGIVPRFISGRDPDAVNNTFNRFYATLMICDFVRQWIVSDGEFDLDFKWLINSPDKDMLYQKVNELVDNLFKIKIQDIAIFTDD